MFDSARPDPGTLDVNEALRQQDSETIRVPAIPKTKPCEVCEGRRECYFEVVGYIIVVAYGLLWTWMLLVSRERRASRTLSPVSAASTPATRSSPDV